MGVPSTRTPVRVARGTYNNLTTTDALAALQEGEIAYATDTNTAYVVETESGTKALRAVTGISASDLVDEDNMASDSATKVPSQQSVKAYVDAGDLSLIDEDNMSTDSATRPPSQQSVKAYVDTADATKAPLASPTFTGTVAIPNIANLETAVAANTAKATNVATNLSVTANGTSLTVASSDGTDASIPAVTTSAWGAMTDEDKTKLDGIATSATANTGDVTLAGTQTFTGIKNFDKPVIGTRSDVGTKTGAFDFDLATANNFKVTVGATAAYGFTNIDMGQSGTIEVVNGAFEMSWGAEVHFVGGTVPTITQSATSFLAYYCPSDTVVFVQHMLNVKQNGT